MAPSPILEVLEVPILLIVLTTGTVLSSISIAVYCWVFREKHWKSSTDLLLLIHSSAQFLCSLSLLIFQIFKLDCMQYLIDNSKDFEQFIIFYREKGRLIPTFTFDFSKFLTYSTTELIAILQCISVRFPFRAETLCSIERVRLFLIPVFLYSLPKAVGHLMLELKVKENSVESETHWGYEFFNPIFPVLLISFTYGVLIWSLRKARNQRQYLIVNQKTHVKTKTYTMIIFIITSNIITNFGFFIAGPIWKFFDKECQFAKHLYWFLGIFLTTEPICTFLSHFIFSSEYHKIIKRTLKFL